jgi:hypothetical protein
MKERKMGKKKRKIEGERNRKKHGNNGQNKGTRKERTST